ncbi:Cytochrome P450 monooxygenase azaI [Fusarium oxysporum f. sp. rapae]|uniref:Cytochrome P450 monooxygenase azaI n=1 Tax=Fusarium oxysporum f. sp. rapae TaxID=485398 RepID=A0A8J5U038_FUSOX|nr:Cytochrome P450 monooxygenase azaI [Fusarium oxysporum f. sp. rapae]
MSSPPYSLQSVALLDPLIKENARRLAKRLGSSISSTSTLTSVDAFTLCGLYSFEVICQAGFAKDFSNDADGAAALKLLRAMDGSALTLLFDGTLPFLRKFGPARNLPGIIGDSYRKRDYWKQKSYEMVDHFLEKSTSDERYLLTPLATAVDSYLGRKLTHEELVEEAMGYMFAGSGTTSSTLSYLLYEISKPENSTIQEHLRAEVLAIPADDIVTIRNNPYINAIIKETFRLHPTIISTIPRLLIEPLMLGEYTLPSGTVVGMQNWLHHRDPLVFPDPDKFILDRWLNETPEMKSALTPFSLAVSVAAAPNNKLPRRSLEECNLVNIPSKSPCGLTGYRKNADAKSYDSVHNFGLTVHGCIKACGTTKPDCKSVTYDSTNGICYFSRYGVGAINVQSQTTGYKFYDGGCGFAASAGGAICGRRGWRQNSAATSYDSVHNGQLDLKSCVAACGTTKPDCKSVACDDVNGICYLFKYDGTTINPADAGKRFAWYDARCLDCSATQAASKQTESTPVDHG